MHKLKLKTGSNIGSDTLTRDPNRPCQNRWPVTWFHIWDKSSKIKPFGSWSVFTGCYCHPTNSIKLMKWKKQN